jgi:glycosyltransferase involved in cell wall biosynthesis
MPDHGRNPSDPRTILDLEERVGAVSTRLAAAVRLLDDGTERRERRAGSRARILVVAADILPLDGAATTGAGLRAWGLGHGLRSRGHHVDFAMPRSVATACGYRGDDVLLYDEDGLDAFVDDIDPDVALFQHWPMAGYLREDHRAFVVIDFHGPLLLETQFREPGLVERLVDTKLRALARADYFVCAGMRQRYYYLAHLLLAGFDIRRSPIAVVPFSLSPDLPSRTAAPAAPTFVYGGVFLPWQDPARGLTVLVEELESAGRGELLMFGGEHPWMGLPSTERLGELRTSLDRSSLVRIHGRISRDQLLGHYASATVAWDLMPGNPERELAFTSRTVEYLWCGLPVIHSDYAELSDLIGAYDAGWTVAPDDEAAIRAVVRSILANPAAVEHKRTNAERLVRERLTWDVAIGPLDEYCSSPFSAPRSSSGPIATGTATLGDDAAAARGPRLVVRPARRALRRLGGARTS